MKIVICDQDQVDTYAFSVSKILNVLNASGALVTNESQVYDFLLPIVDEAQQQDDIFANHETLVALPDLVLQSVSGSDFIWQLARDSAYKSSQR